MPRIEPLADDSAAPPDVRELIYFAEAEGGPDPRMVRILARSEVGVACLRAWRTALFGGLLPHRLKELVRIRMSVLEECGYCSSVRTTRGRAEGITEAVLRALPDHATSPEFDDREKAALHYADLFKANLIDDDEVFADLRVHFSDEEIIELGMFCGLLEARFPKSLQVVTWEQACELDPALGERVAVASES